MKKRYLISIFLTFIILALTSKFWLIFKSSHSAHFEVLLFIIIFICGYLLAFKVTDYLADFKTVKNYSRIEIVFLSLFFIFLFIPMSHITNKEISKTENRVLAKWTPFITLDGKINYNFGKDFDSWFNDRFNLRKIFIICNNKIKFFLASEIYFQDAEMYNKKTHWAFNRNWFIPPDLRDQFPLYKKNILKLEEFCKKNNIKLYVVIPPVNGEVYDKEIYPFKIKHNNGVNFTKYMQDNGFDYIIEPLRELKTASEKEYTHSKSDVHWVEYGAFITYKLLMQRIKEDFPDIKILDENDFNITKSKFGRTDFGGGVPEGTIYRDMLLSEKYIDVEYLVYDFKNINDIKNEIEGVMDEGSFYSNSKNKYKVYLFGTSYEENLFNFVRPSFKQVKKRRYNNSGSRRLEMARWEEEIQKYSPDILILVVNSSGLEQLGFLYGG